MKIRPIIIGVIIFLVLPCATAQPNPFDPDTYDTMLCSLSADPPIKYIQRSSTAIFNISVTDLNWGPQDPYWPTGQSYLIKADVCPEGLEAGYVAALSALSVDQMFPGQTKNVNLMVVAPSVPEAYRPITVRIAAYGYNFLMEYKEYSSLTVTVVPLKFTELEIKTPPVIRVMPGQYITIPVEVKNYGNYMSYIAFNLSIDKGWTFVTPPNPILINANVSMKIPVGVYIPERLSLNENARLRIQVYDIENPKDTRTNVIVLSGTGHYIPYIDSSFKTSFSIPGFDLVLLVLGFAAAGIGCKRHRKN